MTTHASWPLSIAMQQLVPEVVRRSSELHAVAFEITCVPCGSRRYSRAISLSRSSRPTISCTRPWRSRLSIASRVAAHRSRAVMLEARRNPFASSLRRMAAADPRLHIFFQFIQRNLHARAWRTRSSPPTSAVRAHASWRGERGIPSRAMLTCRLRKHSRFGRSARPCQYMFRLRECVIACHQQNARPNKFERAFGTSV